MRPESHTARAYLMTDKLVRAFEGWVVGKVKPAYRYTAAVISRRLAQAVSMQLTDSFLRMSNVEPTKGTVERLEELPEQIHCGEMKINTQIGSVIPSAELLFSCLAKFSALWFFVLWHYIRSFANKNKDIGAATLVYGVPDADLRAEGTSKRFEDFCQFGSLEVLSTSSKCLVQATNSIKAHNSNKFIYARYPLLSLLSGNRLGFIGGIEFLWRHFVSIFGYFAMVLQSPIICLLWRDYAEHTLVESLNKKGLVEAVVITNTNWLQQFLWMSDLHSRKYRTYMALYSLNTSPLRFKDDPVMANHPGIRHLRADSIWIWNPSYENVLRDEGVFCNTEVVGPILWYLPNQPCLYRTKDANTKRVCLFDVSPQSNGALLRSGMLGNYYNSQTARGFLDDVLAALTEARLKLGCEIEILLKHKRTRTSIHDQSYFSYVDKVSGPQGKLRVVKEDLNLFTLISACDLIVVVPYSSPAAIATSLGIKSIYYDPTRELQYPVCGYSHGMFASGKEDLIELVTNVLSQ